MTELLTAAATLLPFATVLTAALAPRTENGRPLRRGERSFTGDLRSLVTLGWRA